MEYDEKRTCTALYNMCRKFYIADVLSNFQCVIIGMTGWQLVIFVYAFNMCESWLELHIWHAPLGVHSAKRRQQSPEWTILTYINCFIRGEVGFHILLEWIVFIQVVRGRPCGLLQFSKGKLMLSKSCYLFCLTFAQCGWMGINAVLGQWPKGAAALPPKNQIKKESI